MMIIRLRCPGGRIARLSNGEPYRVLCLLPEGHDGPHQEGSGTCGAEPPRQGDGIILLPSDSDYLVDLSVALSPSAMCLLPAEHVGDHVTTLEHRRLGPMTAKWSGL